jgi:hypothetical protein
MGLFSPTDDFERTTKMPKMKQFVDSKNHEFVDTNVYEITWMKSGYLADLDVQFCIDSISRSKQPDDYGNHTWILRLIVDSNDSNARVMTRLPYGSEKRDTLIENLQKVLAEAPEDDKIIHGCYLKSIPFTTKSGKERTFLALCETESCGCMCGQSEVDFEESTRKGYDEDPPF